MRYARTGAMVQMEIVYNCAGADMLKCIMNEIVQQWVQFTEFVATNKQKKNNT